MPDLIIRNSDSCWNVDGKTFCNVVLEKKERDDNLMGGMAPTSFIIDGQIKKIKDVKGCWKDKDGKMYCMVNAKGKDGGKNTVAEAYFGQHLQIPSSITNNRSPRRKCDPKTDPYCEIKYK